MQDFINLAIMGTEKLNVVEFDIRTDRNSNSYSAISRCDNK